MRGFAALAAPITAAVFLCACADSNSGAHQIGQKPQPMWVGGPFQDIPEYAAKYADVSGTVAMSPGHLLNACVSTDAFRWPSPTILALTMQLLGRNHNSQRDADSVISLTTPYESIYPTIILDEYLRSAVRPTIQNASEQLHSDLSCLAATRSMLQEKGDQNSSFISDLTEIELFIAGLYKNVGNRLMAEKTASSSKSTATSRRQQKGVEAPQDSRIPPKPTLPAPLSRSAIDTLKKLNRELPSPTQNK